MFFNLSTYGRIANDGIIESRSIHKHDTVDYAASVVPEKISIAPAIPTTLQSISYTVWKRGANRKRKKTPTYCTGTSDIVRTMDLLDDCTIRDNVPPISIF
ncbi:hypothetical protein JR316_0000037 [Psilocybe cubensis]|uniref:Uncharacterized protein n=1 Tax=Psilocybe cubensis TaxID=181762 RepID=A0ACB8HFQ1_PSICU|nr:hypothetical protein JR316_0000037 [Psilocybe cubensis]KAH9485975.1 hypothetical protein JR316_0000037 [Psilocybe cubensis]